MWYFQSRWMFLSRPFRFLLTMLLLASLLLPLASMVFPVTANAAPPDKSGPHLEHLGRGVVALYQGENKVYVSWRLLQSDPKNIKFNLYRSTNGKTVKLNKAPIKSSTNFLDTTVDTSKTNIYFVRPVNNKELAPSAPFTLMPQEANAPAQQYLSIPLKTDINQGARHVGVGDLDGDGEYDFVVKRGDQDIDPSQSTVPVDTYKLEGYKRDGTFLWRVDLGKNIRPGVWYSPFIVFDLDGDGKAEVITKIGETTEDLDGDGIIDYTDAQGRALVGPEYFVVIDGQTGKIRDRENWIPRGNVCDWGDCYGNRVDRHLMTVAYLNGQHPSLIILRGTYTRMYVEAWNFQNGQLSRVWQWERLEGGGGYHNVRVGDIDGDGKDELINGSIAIDDNGTTLWITGEGHGDRHHMTDIDPTRPGKEIWYVQEAGYQHPVNLRDAQTGELIWGQIGNWLDVGRGLAADIDPRYKGLELWAANPSDPTRPTGDLYTSKGESLGPRPPQCNMAIWWDGDLSRELLDGNTIDKWNYLDSTTTRLLTTDTAVGTRNAPMGYGDILGDWREEVWYVYNNSELRIYTTSIVTNNRYVTFMHDPDYRTSVASETMGYMQATQPSFYFGN